MKRDASPLTFSPFDAGSVRLAGEFGRRVGRIVAANILEIDVDETFLSDFRSRGESGDYTGFGKFIDAVVRLAATTKDPRLMSLKRQIVADLIETQEADGYIGRVADPRRRVKMLWDLHEAAYVIWGLVSDYSLFGETASLQSARRLADFHIAKFQANPSLRPDEPHDLPFDIAAIGWDRALLALARATADSKYRDFVINRLRLPEYDCPIRCGTTSHTNHAYGHMSHCLAQLDLYRETGDERLLRAAKGVIEFLRKADGLLVTGSCSEFECWHDTQSGHRRTSETCASAYLARLLDALLQIDGESIHGDMMERDIYNALFAATSTDGRRSRYHTAFEGVRPYDSHGYRYCCANNNKRFLADLAGWMYYRTARGFAVNLYNASTAMLTIGKGATVRVEQQTEYPSNGNVVLEIDPSDELNFEVLLRIPRWCKVAVVAVNGEKAITASGGQYYPLARCWKPGDRIELEMPMQWRFVRGRRSQVGRVALLRGPVVYTFNPARNPEVSGRPEFDPRLIVVNPIDPGPPTSDDSVRPGGTSCVVNAWRPGEVNPWPFVEQIPIVLTEYPDEGGVASYFMVPSETQDTLTDDELVATGTSV